MICKLLPHALICRDHRTNSPISRFAYIACTCERSWVQFPLSPFFFFLAFFLAEDGSKGALLVFYSTVCCFPIVRGLCQKGKCLGRRPYCIDLTAKGDASMTGRVIVLGHEVDKRLLYSHSGISEEVLEVSIQTGNPLTDVMLPHLARCLKLTFFCLEVALPSRSTDRNTTQRSYRDLGRVINSFGGAVLGSNMHRAVVRTLLM
jgi:hypothetical protein